MKKPLTSYLTLLIGLLICGAAIFANQLQLDQDESWGKTRIGILLVGIFFTVFSFLRDKTQRYTARLFKSPVWDGLVIGGIVLVVCIFYVWLISLGQWYPWPRLTTYYDLQATAFRHGRLAIELEPDPALLALSNPYDPAERQNAGVFPPMDFSLYDGKYYLYFGPTPALLAAIIKLFLPVEIGDLHFVFAFSLGIFALRSLIVYTLWQRFFSNLPRWMLYLGILIIGLANSFTPMLMTPGFHEVAITGGQLFLMGGIYFIFRAIAFGRNINRSLTAASIFLAFAVGSRAILVFPIGFMVIMILIWSIKKYSKAGNAYVLRNEILALGIPLFLGAILLGWYNWARFDSVFEFGLNYQLTTNDIQKIRPDIFSPAYILQNSYNYFIQPYRAVSLFPFFRLLDGERASLVSFIKLPAIYYTEGIVGLVWTLPFLIFAILPVVALSQVKKVHSENTGVEEADQASMKWIVGLLFGIFLLSIIQLLAFFWVAPRYTGDFIPTLDFLSMIGFWQGYRFFEHKPGWNFAYVGSVLLIALYSVVMTNLVGISNGIPRIRAGNPLWLERLRDFFATYW